MAASPLLDVQALHAGYGETEVLRGVDLIVSPGEIVAVLGSNGVGKSTLNRTLSGVVRARAGAIHFDGVSIEREGPPSIVARGLMAEPKLLILDEPSLGLSPLLVEELFTLIERIRADGVAILLVEQNVVQSLEVADRAYILADGVFVMSGAAATIADNPELKRAYLGL